MTVSRVIGGRTQILVIDYILKRALEPTPEIRPLAFFCHTQHAGLASKWWITVGDEDASAAKAWEIACAILRYLETYPEAKDTLEGIAQWWLWLELTESRRGELKQAVSLLVSRGLILETRRDGIPSYYGLDPKQRDAITRILRNQQVSYKASRRP